MTKHCLLLLTAFVATAAPPAFEVASVRSNRTGSAGGEGRTGERIDYSAVNLTMTNVTLDSCVKWAYRIRDFQISGAPGWFASARYDIAAKAPGPATEEELRTMLQTLLGERFGLKLRFEKKKIPVYLLVAGKNGPKLRPAAGDSPGNMRPADGGLVFQNVSMADFAERLANRPLTVGRPVVDATGLKGCWDFTMKFAENAAELKSSFEGMERGDAGGPSILTIVQEQLGLRLEPRKDSVDVLMVEHADRVPSGN